MKNITVSVDDETYRLSLIKAAEAGTSELYPPGRDRTGVGMGETSNADVCCEA